jgi:hypothetical protein
MALRPKSLEHGDRLVARSVFWLLIAIYTLTFSGAPGDLDRFGELSYQATRAFALGDGLRITDETPEGATLLSEGELVRPVEGGGIAQVEPLVAISGVPFYLFGAQLARLMPGIEESNRTTAPGFGGARSEYWSHLVTGWRGPLFASLAVWFVCLSCLRLGLRRPTAWIASMVLGTSTCLWPASTSWTSSALAAFCVAATLHALLLVRSRFYRLRAPGPWHWLGLGLALGASCAIEPTFVPVGAVFVISAGRMSVRGRKRLWSMPLLKGEAGARRSVVDLAWLMLPIVALAALWVWGVRERAGEWSTSAALGALGLGGSSASFTSEFVGLLASPGKGLVWLAPWMLFAVLGLPRLAQEPRLLTFCGVAPVLCLASVAYSGLWSTSSTFEPLGALPALVLCWPAVAYGVEAVSRSNALRWTAGALAALGLFANAGGVLVSRGAWEAVTVAAETDLYPDGPVAGTSAFDRRLAWDWHTAAPWVGWRMVRHRTAAAQVGFFPERFPSDEVLLFASDSVYEVRAPRDRGFRRFAWVDLEQRLDGRMWPVLLMALAALGVGGICAASGLDPTCP